MATATLIPSSYYASSAVLSLTNEDNMYTDTSSTTYATLTNTEKSTSYYYFYIRGFNFSDIPSGAEVSSFTIKIRGRASGAYNASLYLAHGTSTISNATATQFPNSSSATTRTFTIPSTLTWATVSGYGSDFGIRINCRRNARNTQSYYYIYGAEIDVTYTVPVVTDKLYFKQNGAWTAATKAYKKINGIWVEQNDLTTVFDTNTNYVKG